MQRESRTRREFVKHAAAFGASLSFALTGAASYSRVIGANSRIQLAFVGVRSRGSVLFKAAQAAESSGIGLRTFCDVDSTILLEQTQAAEALTGTKPRNEVDFRRVLEDDDIDAIVIASPDHTHAPFAIMAAQAGKHVYVEKPCSHNPKEGEMLVEAATKYDRIVQMGNQQRSAPTSIEAVEDIRGGAIGKPYLGKAWYANNRESIGTGKKMPVPKGLDWDLWQGPAPRRDYQDNVVHYNWHWFRHWGTGEINNNALHEIDVCRWALGVDLPNRVSSVGGRYHFEDDWEFCDTQTAIYEYEDAQIVWEGRSCNGFKTLDRGRGATIHGTNGTALLDRNGYFLYDITGRLIKQVNEREVSGTTDLVGAGALDIKHLKNFFNAIRDGESLHSPIAEGATSTLMCHLGNIAQKLNRPIEIDTSTRRARNDADAMQMWEREYERNWEPKV